VGISVSVYGFTVSRTPADGGPVDLFIGGWIPVVSFPYYDGLGLLKLSKQKNRKIKKKATGDFGNSDFADCYS